MRLEAGDFQQIKVARRNVRQVAGDHIEWAAQWSRYGVRINNLAPGFIETEMTEGIINQENIQAWILRNTMLPRHGAPNDFDGALLFLASGASAYVTGHTLRVDGGWTAR